MLAALHGAVRALITHPSVLHSHMDGPFKAFLRRAISVIFASAWLVVRGLGQMSRPVTSIGPGGPLGR
eukprot:9886828-Karenia_brevis.AAC.1